MKPHFIKLFSLPAAGVCFLREVPERAIGSDRRTGKWGLTLTAMANVLQNYPQEVVTKEDYLKHLQIYSNSHRLKLPAKDGKPAQTICWIDENLHPQTGEWLARALLKEKAKTSKDPGKLIKERGQHYNHSIFCDLIITGLCGLQSRPDSRLVIRPLVPDNTWSQFKLENIAYHGKTLTVQWDQNGKKYGQGKGLQVIANGKVLGQSDALTELVVDLK